MSQRGIINNGTTCYMNSILQALNACKSAKTAIMQMPQDMKIHELLKKNNPNGSNNSDLGVVCALQQLIVDMNTPNTYPISTYALCVQLGIQNQNLSNHEDADEFLKALLNKCDFACINYDKINKTSYKENYNRVFTSQEVQTVCCDRCKTCSESQNEYQDITLPVTTDFFESLAQIMNVQRISQYQCKKCQSEQDAKIYKHYQKIPELLQITVQRFSQIGNQFSKNDQQMNFPLYIDVKFIHLLHQKKWVCDQAMFAKIAQYILMPWLHFNVIDDKIQLNNVIKDTRITQLLKIKEFDEYIKKYYKNMHLKNSFQNNENEYEFTQQPVFQNDTPDSLYRLKAIVCHSGTLNHGHYITLAMNHQQNLTQLITYNDTNVTISQTPISILKQIAGIEKQNNGQSQEILDSGYIYFYESCNLIKPDLKQLCMFQQEQEQNSKQINIFVHKTIQVKVTFDKSCKQIQLSFDTQQSCKDFVEQVKQLLNVNTSGIYDSVNMYLDDQHTTGLQSMTVLSQDCETNKNSIDQLFKNKNMCQPSEIKINIEFVNFRNKIFKNNVYIAEIKINHTQCETIDIINYQVIKENKCFQFKEKQQLNIDVQQLLPGVSSIYGDIVYQQLQLLYQERQHFEMVVALLLRLSIALKLNIKPQQLAIFYLQSKADKKLVPIFSKNNQIDFEQNIKIFLYDQQVFYYEILEQQLNLQQIHNINIFKSDLQEKSYYYQFITEKKIDKNLVKLNLLDRNMKILIDKNVSDRVPKQMLLHSLQSQLTQYFDIKPIQILHQTNQNTHTTLIDKQYSLDEKIKIFNKKYLEIIVQDALTLVQSDILFAKVEYNKFIECNISLVINKQLKQKIVFKLDSDKKINDLIIQIIGLFSQPIIDQFNVNENSTLEIEGVRIFQNKLQTTLIQFLNDYNYVPSSIPLDVQLHNVKNTINISLY